IKAPNGPLSKPKAGGYILEDTLGWDHGLYRDVQQKGLHKLATDHLNKTLSYEHQSVAAKTSFLKAV
ncbi:hypothetical protein OF83DRAFT_1045398, partial [Amylostereum chailletii]